MQLGTNNFLLFVIILTISSTKSIIVAAEAVDEKGSGAAKPLISVKYVEKIKASKKSEERVTAICSKCKNNELCEQTVLEVNKEADPKTLNPINAVDIQLASMLEVIELASMDCAVLGKDKSYELCGRSYAKALEKLSNAMWACEEAVDPVKAMENTVPPIPQAIKNIESCQKELKISNKSMLIEVNDFIAKLGDNCVALANDISAGDITVRK